jgi:hypothetical protein
MPRLIRGLLTTGSLRWASFLRRHGSRPLLPGRLLIPSNCRAMDARKLHAAQRSFSRAPPTNGTRKNFPGILSIEVTPHGSVMKLSRKTKLTEKTALCHTLAKALRGYCVEQGPLDHASTSTTAIYTHLDFEHLAKVSIGRRIRTL